MGIYQSGKYSPIPTNAYKNKYKYFIETRCKQVATWNAILNIIFIMKWIKQKPDLNTALKSEIGRLEPIVWMTRGKESSCAMRRRMWLLQTLIQMAIFLYNRWNINKLIIFSCPAIGSLLHNLVYRICWGKQLF